MGNKVDLEREGLRVVETEDGKDFKTENNLAHFVETNARDASHIENLFNVVRDKLVEKEE